MELIQEVQANLVNYKTLLEPTEASAIRIIKDNPDKKITISVVIPVRGRQRMHEPVVKYFAAAMEYNQDVQVDIIIVEHSQHQEHAWIAAKMGIANYVWLPSKSNEPFNKCLCHNVGAVVCQADYYLFHDIDTLVPEDFFTRLLENWKNQSAHGAGALQCFTKRRLLHCNKSLAVFSSPRVHLCISVGMMTVYIPITASKMLRSSIKLSYSPVLVFVMTRL